MSRSWVEWTGGQSSVPKVGVGWCRPYAVKLLAGINPVADLGVLLFEKLEEFPYQENKENGCGQQ